MPCCGKKRRVAEARRRGLEENDKRNFKSIRDKNPALLNDKLLVDYHRKTHMVYGGAVIRKPVNKPSVNAIVDLHDKFVEEMLNRGIKHNTPLKKV